MSAAAIFKKDYAVNSNVSDGKAIDHALYTQLLAYYYHMMMSIQQTDDEDAYTSGNHMNLLTMEIPRRSR